VGNKMLFSISDSEIYDAYMSAPTHFNEVALFEEGRSRSILYSRREDRSSLARKLSRQIYGHKELRSIEQYFSQIGRTDKVAAVQLDAPLTQEELKSVVDDFAGDALPEEEITTFLDGPNLIVNTLYTQTDYSRNRFRQRQQKEAVVKFEIGAD